MYYNLNEKSTRSKKKIEFWKSIVADVVKVANNPLCYTVLSQALTVLSRRVDPGIRLYQAEC